MKKEFLNVINMLAMIGFCSLALAGQPSVSEPASLTADIQFVEGFSEGPDGNSAENSFASIRLFGDAAEELFKKIALNFPVSGDQCEDRGKVYRVEVVATETAGCIRTTSIRLGQDGSSNTMCHLQLDYKTGQMKKAFSEGFTCHSGTAIAGVRTN